MAGSGSRQVPDTVRQRPERLPSCNGVRRPRVLFTLAWPLINQRYERQQARKERSTDGTSFHPLCSDSTDMGYRDLGNMGE